MLRAQVSRRFLEIVEAGWRPLCREARQETRAVSELLGQPPAASEAHCPWEERRHRPASYPQGWSNLVSPMLLQAQAHQQQRCMSSSSSSSGDSSSSPPPSSTSAAAAEPIKVSLQDALTRLVDAAVERVEANDLDTAISILKEGITEFEPVFTGSPEVGEMHNQAALLLFFNNKADEASHHAEVALEATRKRFGDSSRLTGHRLLRLGAIRFGQGRLSDASALLGQAISVLGDDSSRNEAELYLALGDLASAADAVQVRQQDDRLVGAVKRMKQTFGGDSIVLALGLNQHDRVLNQALAAQQQDIHLCEALFKQHAKMVAEVDPEGEDLAICNYKLGTFFYSHDMLPDAGSYIQRAAGLLRARYPEEHDLVVMCKHRMGMVCAASGDHRSAVQLLSTSKAHYLQQDTTQALAKEADLGLAMAKYRSLAPAQVDAQTRQAALHEVQSAVDGLAATIGSSHMLVQGAMRYFSQMNATAKW